MTMTYEAVTLSGETIDNRGRGYVSRRAAQRAAERRGAVAVETRRLSERLPHRNDAQAWDELRTRNGHPSY
jgi:hypothetical protein